MGKATVIVAELRMPEANACQKGSSEEPCCLSLVVPSLSDERQPEAGVVGAAYSDSMPRAPNRREGDPIRGPIQRVHALSERCQSFHLCSRSH